MGSLCTEVAATSDAVAELARFLPRRMRDARRYLLRDARKRPFYITGAMRHGELDAEADRAQLATLPQAMEALDQAGDGWGLGFALGYDDDTGEHWQGIDFDHVVGADGEIEDALYRRLYAAAGSYAERSPSGDGLHIIGTGRAFDALRWPAKRSRGAAGIECYSSGRYFTVTGDVMRQAELADLADLVEQLREELAARGDAPARSASARPRRSPAEPGSTTDNIRAYCSAHPIEDELWRNGFRRIGRRWLSPRSQSGVPGVHVHGEHAVSFHASDSHLGSPCADGQAVIFDAFDLAVQAHFGGDRLRAIRELLPRSTRSRTDAPADDTDAPEPSELAEAELAELNESPSDPESVAAHSPTRTRGKSRRGGRAAPKDDSSSTARELPQAAAARFLAARYTVPTGIALRYWQSGFVAWTGSHFEPMPDPDVRAQLYEHLGPDARKRQVDEVLDALRARANLSNLTIPPAWVPREAADPDAAGLVPMANGLLRIDDRALLAPSARLFATWGLPFGYQADAAPPVRWLAFLSQLWPDDPQSRALLQEFAGYLVSGSTALQKALLIVGPKRSGKGTLARVLTQLMGPSNVVSPTLASLGTQFGLQPLIGKTLALISDARLSAQADVATTVENILRITGEDQVTIPRKFLPDYTATLPARIVVLSNEAPRFTDASAALPSRFLVLTTTESFYGRENTSLTGELLAELPGIFAWALDGLLRLRERGRFTQPAAGAEVVDEMERLASPVRAFVDEQCVIHQTGEIQCVDLFNAWQDWCKVNGRRQSGTLQTFGRDLRAACSSIRTVQRREANRARFYEGIRLRQPEDDGGPE